MSSRRVMDILLLISTPKRASKFRNVNPTLEIWTQKRLGTLKMRFCVVEML